MPKAIAQVRTAEPAVDDRIPDKILAQSLPEANGRTSIKYNRPLRKLNSPVFE